MAMAPESHPPSTGKSKKSKFRRSTSGPANNVTTNNMVSPPSKQLEFHQAMSDFKTMFPKMDHDVIEAVLRANNGAVDATIDQLLVMNVDMQQEDNRRSFVDDDTIPPEVFEPTSDDDEPPPAYTPHAQPKPPSLQDPTPPYTPPATAMPAVTPVSTQMTTPTSRQYRNWNPPMLGSLPDDFLRVGIGSSPSSSPQSMATPQLQKQLEQNRQQRSEIDKNDVEMQQRLDDEELAIMLQNEEFLRELQTSPEFIASLERDQRATLGGGASLSSHDPQFGMGAHGATAGAYGTSQQGNQVEDADFKDKLSHMGKSTKKKFAQLAKRFQRKKKRSAKASLQESAAAPSTANLLDDLDDEYDEDDDEAERLRRERLSQGDDDDVPRYHIQRPPYHQDQVLTLNNDRNNEAIV